MAEITVILPVYNRERHLPSTIQSVVAQTRTDWHLAIVDDGSTDASFQIACEAAELDPRISAVQLDKNSGNPAKPRNIATRTTDSRFIAYIDSDDTWAPEKLERHIDFMQCVSSPFSFTAYNVVDEEDELKRVYDNLPAVVNSLTYLNNTCLAPSTVMTEREKVSLEFPEGVKIGEDFWAFYETLKTQEARGLNETLTNYRRSYDAITSSRLQSAWEQAKRYTVISKDIGIPQAVAAYALYAFNAIHKRTEQREKTLTRPGP
jgi:teichuronic acid biosynthesis glycosyltransferase TuaG